MNPDNKNNLTEEEKKQVEQIIRDLSTAIKNSVLYTPDHSICSFSINNFRETLNKWFKEKERIDLGITKDSIFLSGVSFEGKNVRHQEAANYLHLRGIVLVTILKGIEKEELVEFFNHVRKDAKTIRNGGGILKDLPKLPHLQLKEIDYSALLKKSTTAGKEISEEDEVWQFLFDLTKEKKGTKLPADKADLLVNFLKDPKKAAKTLNKVYKEAREEMRDDKMAEETRQAIMKICEHLDTGDFKEIQESKVKLMDVITQLHPDLITNLFEQTEIWEKLYIYWM